MTDKPLNVRVAEALGLKLARHWDGILYPLGHPDTPPDAAWCLEAGGRIPPYGEESPEGWACTGPLISSHCPEIIIRDWRRVSSRSDFRGGVCDKRGEFQAYPPGDPVEGWGAAIPEAVARLIVALAEAGRLPK